MTRKSNGDVKERSIRLSPEVMDKADKIAKKNYTSFNGLVEMLVDPAIEYHDLEGRMPTPIMIVNELEFEEFGKWKAAKGAGLFLEQNPMDAVDKIQSEHRTNRGASELASEMKAAEDAAPYTSKKKSTAKKHAVKTASRSRTSGKHAS